MLSAAIYYNATSKLPCLLVTCLLVNCLASSQLAKLKLFNTHFFQQTVGVSPLIHEVYHVANVDADATCELAVEPDVRRERVPVAIEGETDEAALAIKHGRA